MKRILFFAVLATLSTTLSAQESNAYLGVSIGYSTPGGESMEGINDGLELGFVNFGYRFSENIGATLNLNSSGHTIEDVDDVNVGVAYFSFGPMFSQLLSDKFSIDFKPQYAPSLVAAYTDDSGEIYEGTELRGGAFVIANSIVFGNSKGFGFSINQDLLLGKWNSAKINGESFDLGSDLGYDEDDKKITKFTVSFGVRYNF